MHIISKKVYYHDTDKAGVVYYANYLKYFEEARTEFLLSKGIDLKRLHKEGIFFVVKKIEVDYRGPAYYGETIEVFSEVVKVKNVSLFFRQGIKLKEKLLVEAKVLLVCVDTQFRPRPFPSWVKEKLNVSGSK